MNAWSESGGLRKRTDLLSCSYDEIVARVEQLERENPDLVQVTDLGKTHENRRIIMVRLGRSRERDSEKAIWIDAGGEEELGDL